MNKHRIALVTGASRGIGAAIAKQLVADGDFVIGTATSDAGVEKIQQNLKTQGQGMVLDVRDRASLPELVKVIEKDFGAIQVLVNNAGVTDDQLLLRMTDQAWDEVITVHLNAVYGLSKAVLKGMLRAKSGRIINLSSVVAHIANSGQSNYSAAKAGIEAFSRSLAQEVGSRGITVNCVAPGFIATDMTAALTEAQQQQMLAQIALKRLGEAQDVADAVSFLASEKAKYVTGNILHVNGGLFMN